MSKTNDGSGESKGYRGRTDGQAFASWPGESNGTPRTSGHESVTTPDDCPVCGGEIADDLPNHLRSECERTGQ